MQPADIAWLLAAAAMVLLMFPGLAFLYGGMLDDRNVLNMLMMVMSGLAVGGVAYVVLGHGLVFGDSVGGLRLSGNPAEFAFFDAFVADDGASGL